MEHIKTLEDIIRAYAPPVLIYGLMILGALQVAAAAYVAATPSPEDDLFLNRLLDKPILKQVFALIKAFSPIVKKEGAIELSNKPEKK